MLGRQALFPDDDDDDDDEGDNEGNNEGKGGDTGQRTAKADTADAAGGAAAGGCSTAGVKGRVPWQVHLALTIPKQAGGAAQELHRDGDLSLVSLAARGLPEGNGTKRKGKGTGKQGCDHAISVIWALDADFTEVRLRLLHRKGRRVPVAIPFFHASFRPGFFFLT